MLVNIAIFVFGAIIGSFLNVCIYRLPRERSIINPPSSCPNCGTPINWRDNIPILSYCLLRGKCRKCKTPISIRYLIVELLTGLLFLFIRICLAVPAGRQGFSISAPEAHPPLAEDLEFYFIAAFISYLIIAFFSDLETQLLPDWPSYIMIVLGIIYNFIGGNLVSSLWGLFWGFSILYLIGFIGKLIYKKDVLGGGDVKLTAAFGAFLGSPMIFAAILLGYIIGAASSIALIATKRKTLHDYIPFAPSLAAGALIALFFGKIIIDLCLANCI